MIIAVVITSQILFLISDLLGRHYMPMLGFRTSTFISWWFLGYQAIRFVATLGQLYIFTHLELGKTMTLFATASLVMANLAGYLLLGELLDIRVYIGVLLAITAFIVVAFAK